MTMVRKKKLLFVSYDNYADPSNGASISSREMLLGLTERDWSVHTYCADKLDFKGSTNVFQSLANRGMVFLSRSKNRTRERFSIEHFRDNRILSSLLLPENNHYPPTKEVGKIFLRLLQETIRSYKPDIVLTYGGNWLGMYIIRLAALEGCKVCVNIHNCSYQESRYCGGADLMLVPSMFAAEYYRKKLGVASVAVPPVMQRETENWSPNPEKRKYLTFVNPDANKGVFWFAAIVKELSAIRPDIPILMVQGRGRWEWVLNLNYMFSGHNNLFGMENTPHPMDFYELSKLVLIPSLWNETFGRVAAEAMLNGIPVIASNRGSLPEVVGDAGILLDIPSKYQPNTTSIPSSNEVKPWVESILQVWDDQEYYNKLSDKGRERSRCWQCDDVVAQYDAILTDLIDGKYVKNGKKDKTGKISA